MPIVTFDTVYSYIKSECNRGDSVDQVLAGKIQQAVSFIEKNYTLKYQERLVRFSLLPGATAPGPYDMPDDFKASEFMRLVNIAADGSATYTRLTKFSEPSDHLATHIGPPTHWWEDGFDFFWFNGIVQTETPVDLLYYRFSPRFLEDSTCWLFDNGLEAVVAKTMELMVPWLRQPALLAAYKPMWNEGIKTLLLADQEARAKSTSVQFGELAP